MMLHQPKPSEQDGQLAGVKVATILLIASCTYTILFTLL